MPRTAGTDDPAPVCATLWHMVDVSVRELRNHTARVMAAVQSGQPVVLTVHGRPVADITPRTTRVERMPTEQVLAGLERIRETARRVGGHSDPADYDTGLTTDDW